MAQLLNGHANAIKKERAATQLATVKVPALRNLPPFVQGKVRQSMTVRVLTSGSTLRMGGGQRNDVFFLVVGSAVGVKNDLNTTEIIPLNEGDAFTDYGVGIDALRPSTVVTHTCCIVCAMPVRLYKQYLAEGRRTKTGKVSVWSMLLNWLTGEAYTGSRVRT
jgi:hypothetical protein